MDHQPTENSKKEEKKGNMVPNSSGWHHVEFPMEASEAPNSMLDLSSQLLHSVDPPELQEPQITSPRPGV